MNSRRFTIVSGVAALVVGLGACGSSAPSAGPVVTVTPVSTAPPTAPPTTGVPMPSTEPAADTTSASAAEASVTMFPEQSQDHVETPVDYAQSPPIGGEHSKIWQNCGFYSTPIANENGVHSLEHGAAWITYSPDLPADQQAELKAMATGHTHVLISPYPGLATPVVGSAWRVQQPFAEFDAAAIEAFIDTYELGPTTPEWAGGVPGQAVTCADALGTPES